MCRFTLFQLKHTSTVMTVMIQITNPCPSCYHQNIMDEQGTVTLEGSYRLCADCNHRRLNCLDSPPGPVPYLDGQTGREGSRDAVKGPGRETRQPRLGQRSWRPSLVCMPFFLRSYGRDGGGSPPNDTDFLAAAADDDDEFPAGERVCPRPTAPVAMLR